ncbi:trimethylamine methyltransferase family protein [Candidatus Poribacteria bacterium]
MKLQSQIRVLSESEMDRIFEGAVDVVRSISMQVRHEKMLEVLSGYGCEVDMEKQRVRFPMTVLQSLLDDIERQKAKARKARESAARETPEDGKIKLSCSASGQGLWAHDLETDEIRPATRQDLADVSRLIDAIPGLGRGHPTFIPQDVPVQTQDIHTLATIALNYSDPGAVSVYSPESVDYMVELGIIIRGSMEELRKRPCFHFSMYMTTPFKLCGPNVETALRMHKYGLAARLGGIFSIAGATTPVTLAGTLVHQTSENLISNIINRAFANIEGPSYGGSPLILDMKFAQQAENSPESHLMKLATGQIAQYCFGIGSGAGAGNPVTSAKIPGAQAVFEKTQALMFGLLSGARSFGSVGTLASADVGSLTQIIIDMEIIKSIQRLLNGIDVTDHKLAVDVIKEVGSDGNYLAHEHTVKYMREEVWYPEILDRRNVGGWLEDPKTMVENAKEKVRDILLHAENKSALDEHQKREIVKLLKRADQQLR